MPDIALLCKPSPIHMVGDSHCKVFSGELFDEQRNFNERFLTRATYVPNLTGQSFADETGSLKAPIIFALCSAGLVEVDAQGVVHPNAAAAGDAPLVTFLGEEDLRNNFLRSLAPDTDFELPPGIPNVGFDLAKLPKYHAGRTIDAQTILNTALGLLEPFGRGLLVLRKLGLVYLYVHMLPPPTIDDEEFAAATGFFVPAAVRYKAVRLFNSILKFYCTQVGARPIDIWEAATIEGRRNPLYHLDAIHLNREAALLSLEVLMKDLIQHRRANERLWAQAAEIARAEAAKSRDWNEEVEAQFLRDGIVTMQIDESAVEPIREQLDFCHDVGNHHTRADWAGHPVVAPYGGYIHAAYPGIDIIRTVHELFYSDAVHRVVSACFRSDFCILNVRPYKSLPREVVDDSPGPQLLHTDGNPPGILRGLLYLTDVDEDSGPFEYLDPAGNAVGVVGRRGTIAIFDADRLKHRARPPRNRHREVLDLIFAPLLPGTTRTTMWSGMNHWPVDPFKYSTDGYLVYPSR